MPVPSKQEPIFIVIPVVFVLWNLAYLVMGSSALAEDWGLSSSYCGKTTHIFKFCLLSLVFAAIDLISYVFFPGGGEGARARAIVLIGLHFAFAVWGVLMWVNLDDICTAVLGGKTIEYTTLVFTFQHIATIHNSVLLVLVVLHESWPHPEYGDFTLKPILDRHEKVGINATLYQSEASSLASGSFAETQDVPEESTHEQKVPDMYVTPSTYHPIEQQDMYGNIFEESKAA